MSSDAERLVRSGDVEKHESPVAGRRVASSTGKSPFRRRAGKPRHRRDDQG